MIIQKMSLAVREATHIYHMIAPAEGTALLAIQADGPNVVICEFH